MAITILKQGQVPTAAKVQAAMNPSPGRDLPALKLEPAADVKTSKFTAKVEPKTVKLERARAALASVSNAQPVSNGAARIARWRAKQDPEVRKQQNREAVQRSRAKRKAGKAVGS